MQTEKQQQHDIGLSFHLDPAIFHLDPAIFHLDLLYPRRNDAKSVNNQR